MFRKLHSLLLAALLLLLCLPMAAAAESAGVIRISLHAVEDGTPVPEATLAVYRVADYAGQDLHLTGDFADTGLMLADFTDEPSRTAETLDAYLEERELSPLRTGKTDKEGQLVLDGMDDGIYFVCMVPDAATDEALFRSVSMKSFVAALPSLEEGEQLRDISCRPKCEVTNLTSVSVTKVWRDNNSKTRPAAVTVALYDGDTQVEQVTLNAGNRWTYVWKNLLAEGDYSVRELEVPKGYTAAVTEPDANTFVVTNSLSTLPPKTGDSSETRLWTGLLLTSAALALCCAAALGRTRRRA